MYIVPRLIHGLEVTKSHPSEIEYQRRTLKQLQHLSTGASNNATYLLSGVLPIQAEIEERMLTIFVRLISDPATDEYIKRQIVIKDLNSNPWTVDIRKLLQIFDLPSCHDLLRNTPTEVLKAVSSFYSAKLKREMEQQSSTRYIDSCACSLSKPHNISLTAGSKQKRNNKGNAKNEITHGGL